MRTSRNGATVGAVAAVLAITVAGCNSTIYGPGGSGVAMLQVNPKQRLVLHGTGTDGRRIVCAEPYPDELGARAAILALQDTGASPPPSTDSVAQAKDVRAGRSVTDRIETIALQSTSIQLLREGYYRLCEGLINGAISEQEYQDSVKKIDTSIAPYMALLFHDASAAEGSSGTPSLQASAPTPVIPVSEQQPALQASAQAYAVEASVETSAAEQSALNARATDLIAGAAQVEPRQEKRAPSANKKRVPVYNPFSGISAGQLPVKKQWLDILHAEHVPRASGV